MRHSGAILLSVLASSAAATEPVQAAAFSIPKLAAPTQCRGADGYVDAFGGRRTFLLEPDELNRLKAGREEDPAANAAIAELLTRADAALARRPGSVRDKKRLPPSGDRRDYMSLAPYWWPDPSKPGGAYVRRDGEVNPERATTDFDRTALSRMVADTETLALAYFHSDDPRYAAKAAQLVRTWFLASATAMNPNMNYAQAVPGRAEGRAEGVLDTSGFMKVIDAVGLIAPSGALSRNETAALEKWFGRYVDWMLTSRHGRAEQAAKNNHGLWYDAQIAHFALFARRPELAENVVLAFPRKRIATQFAPSGELPEELVRTRSFHYSVYSLHAAYDVAELAACLGYDLWRYSGPEGRSLRKATDFVAAYQGRSGEWPHEEREWPAAGLEALLARAAAIWPKAYPRTPSVAREIFGELPDGRPAERFRLTNARGTIVELISYGAAIARIALPRPGDAPVDVVVGPADLAGFVGSRRRFAIVGRYAGRLRGSVTIDGKNYPLKTNLQGVTVHGGDPGFDRALWSGIPFETPAGVGVVFTHVSPDGDQGFPGTLKVTARYTLERNADALVLDMEAVTDRPTVANLTNHAYFNLAGEGTVACHRLTVDADRYVAINARKLPTGALPPVEGSRLNFTRGRLIAETLQSGGLDDMLVMRPGGSARLSDEASGRSLTITTDQPGLQVFTGNGFDGSDRDRGGRPIVRHGGIALEPEHFPDSPWIAHFPSTAVTPAKPLRWHTRWAFDQEPPKPRVCRAS
jgi:galactose mutarotase-like enzyme